MNSLFLSPLTIAAQGNKRAAGSPLSGCGRLPGTAEERRVTGGRLGTSASSQSKDLEQSFPGLTTDN
jgi:hypothetical protein